MTTTYQQLVDKLTEANNSEIKANRIHKAVAAWIKTEEGKPLNGWCEKRAKKHFATLGWEIRFGTVCGDQNYLHVWGGDSGYTDKEPVRMFLGYGKDMGSLNVAVFEDRNCSYGSAAEQRIADRSAMINNQPWLNLMAGCIDDFKKAKQTLQDEMGQAGPRNEAFYIIRDLAGLEPKR